MVKQVEHILQRTLETATHKPSLMELITFCSNAVRVVNERPFTALSDVLRDLAVVTSASLLTPAFDPHTPVGRAHDWDHLRRDYRFNVALADRFWKDWVAFYLSTLQERNKWKETSKNLQIEYLILVGNSIDISEKEKYRVGKVAEVFPQMHNRNPIVRRAKIAVTEYDSKTDSYKVEYIYCDISRIAPVQQTNSNK